MSGDLKNPLKPFALVAIFSIAIDCYHAASAHEISFLVALRTILAVPFLVFYFRKSPMAWLASLFFLLPIGPIYLMREYLLSPSHFPSLGVLAVLAVLYACLVFYLFEFRRRYGDFLRSSRSPV